VAIEIARRARVRLEIEGTQMAPVEAKILLPLIEKSSIEDMSDNSMLDRWSALLATAASSDKVQPRYIQILSELSSRQANLFEKIMLNESKYFPKPEQHFLDSSETYSSPRIREAIHSFLREKKNKMDPEDVHQTILRMLDRPGCAIVDIVIFTTNQVHSFDIASYFLRVDRFFELDLEILESLGLLRKVSIFTKTKFLEELELSYYHATDLGVFFFGTVDSREKNLNPIDGTNI
jgi:hypothetical protein